MGTRSTLKKMGTVLLVSSALLYSGLPALGNTPSSGSSHGQRKNKKKQAEPPPPLPSGPTGRPVPPVPLDSMAAVPPQVTYENSQLTIVAPNSTLADILRAVHKLTGAEIEIPVAPERVVTRLGPGPAREVVADLLNGSRFNYILLGSPGNETALTRVVLVAKSGPQEVTPNNPPPQPGEGQADNQPEQEVQQEAEAEPADDNSGADENADQAAEGEQPPQDQNGVKTPQQMLQEMQQRQMQQQQQQQQIPGQPPIPGGAQRPQEQ